MTGYATWLNCPLWGFGGLGGPGANSSTKPPFPWLSSTGGYCPALANVSSRLTPSSWPQRAVAKCRSRPTSRSAQSLVRIVLAELLPTAWARIA